MASWTVTHTYRVQCWRCLRRFTAHSVNARWCSWKCRRPKPLEGPAIRAARERWGYSIGVVAAGLGIGIERLERIERAQADTPKDVAKRAARLLVT